MRSKTALFAMLIAFVCGSTLAAPPAARPRAQLDFELITEKGFALNGAQKWHTLFSDLQVGSVRIRSAQPGDRLGLESRGTPTAPAYKVVGQLTASGTLVLPGGKFALTDKARLQAWLNELGDNGIEGVVQKKAAFGLTQAQLQEVNEDLKQAVDFATAGQPPGAVVGRIRAKLRHTLVPDPALGKIFPADMKVAEELQGLSVGTAMAIVLRPAGAVLMPRRPTGGNVELLVVSAKDAPEAWPIGYAPEGGARTLLPIMFDYLTIEFDNVPANEALEALQTRLKVPFIYDHNAIAQHQLDVTKPVALPPKRTFYGAALSTLLFKVGLKEELRVDEAGKVFLWITSLKRS